MVIDLDTILGLPQRAVVAELSQGVARVGYTSSMGAYLETLYNNRVRERGARLEIWSAGADLETLKLHSEYFKLHYNRLGYEVAPSARATLQYRVRMVPAEEFKWMHVELVTARGQAKVVARFKTQKEAQEFIAQFYGDGNPFNLPVYALNSATKEFLGRRQTKMLEIR